MEQRFKLKSAAFIADQVDHQPVMVASIRAWKLDQQIQIIILMSTRSEGAARMLLLFQLCLALRQNIKLSFQQLFYLSALVPTVAIVSYGAAVSHSGADFDLLAEQRSYNDQYHLKYADGSKALFKTDDELILVVVGSSLSSAGHVVSIEKRNERWTVTTNKQLTFVQE